MSNYWNIPGVPHRGWTLINVEDVREEGESEEETDYESCMMCGNEKIRYVHILEHPDINEEYRVGCVCAEKMTGDYVNPGQREKELRNRSNRRLTWLTRKWKTSAKGNDYLNIDDHNVSVMYDEIKDTYKCRIDGTFGTLKYPTKKAAKMALFKKIEHLKEHSKW